MSFDPEFVLADIPSYLKPEWARLRPFVNSTPVVLSLLYDLDLMLEQITSQRDFERMILVARHFQAAIQPEPNVDYEAALYEIGEIVRVARDNPAGLTDFLKANFPREWGLNKKEHRAHLKSWGANSQN